MATAGGRRIRVADVIAQAKKYGCEYRASQMKLITPGGTYPIKYLYSPRTKARFDLTDYELDDYMLESELSAAERRLKIILRCYAAAGNVQGQLTARRERSARILLKIVQNDPDAVKRALAS